jgi:hypothetical protein
MEKFLPKPFRTPAARRIRDPKPAQLRKKLNCPYFSKYLEKIQGAKERQT